MFLHVSVILFTGGCAWQVGGGVVGGPCMAGGMCGRGVCKAGGCAWWGGGGGACMAGGHAWQGEVCGREGMCSGGHAWQGECMAGGMCGRGHAWQGVHGRGCMAGGHACHAWPPSTMRYGRSMHGRYASYWNAFLLLLNADLNIVHCCGKLQLNKPLHIVNYTGEARPYSPQNKKKIIKKN